MTSGQVLDLLEQKFCLPGFIFLREVRDATGFDSNREAVVKPAAEQLEKQLNEKYQNGYEAGQRSVGHDVTGYKNLREAVEEFEKASGIHLYEFRHRPKQIGDAVRLVMKHSDDAKRLFDSLDYQTKRLLEIAKNARDEFERAQRQISIESHSEVTA